jgi:hypothetical protein
MSTVNTAAAQRPLLLLDMSPPQGPELNLEVSREQPLLLLDMSTQQRQELHLDLMYLDYRRLFCPWTCLGYRGSYGVLYQDVFTLA